MKWTSRQLITFCGVLVFSLSALPSSAQPIPPRRLVLPGYPSIARLGATEGVIQADIEIGESGLVKSVNIADHDKKLSVLAYAVMSTVSKWRLVDERKKVLHITFAFKLMPHDCPDSDLETVIDLHSQVTIKERRMPPISNSPTIDPPALK